MHGVFDYIQIHVSVLFVLSILINPSSSHTIRVLVIALGQHR